MKLPVWTCAVAAAALLVGGCSGNPNKGISVQTVRRGTVSEVVDAPAAVTPRASATLTAPAAGRIANLNVRDGQRIAAGAVVAVIDSPAARQRLEQAHQAAASTDSSSIRVPGVDLSGVQAQTDAAADTAFVQAEAALAKIPDPTARATAQAQLTASKAQYALAQVRARATVRQFNAGLAGLGTALQSLTAAQRAQGRAAVAVAQSTIDSLTLRSPISGTVQIGGMSSAAGNGLSDLLSQLPAGAQGVAGAATSAGGTTAAAPVASTAIAPGAQVSAGTAVVTVLDVSRLGLSADVDETDVLLVKAGIRARVELDALPGATYDATVSAVDLSPTTSGRGGVSYHVRLALGAGTTADGAAAAVPRPGMSAVAHLLVRTARDAVALPASAVVRSGARNAVWIVLGGAAQRRFVTLGTQGEDTVAVLDGVAVGDRVVVAGAERVHAGQKLP